MNYRTPQEVMVQAEPVIRAALPDANVPVSVRSTGVPGTDRVRALSPTLAKGLEIGLVVLVDPDRFGTGIEGAVDRYVAMTRATQRLAVLTSQ